MTKTFRKRSGTTDKGKDYEILNIANIAMNLVKDEKIRDFEISSNDEEFGDFDDIVVETVLAKATEIYALQLKHTDRGNLSLKQLTQAKGDFSIKKYFASCQSIKANNAKFILFTNLKFDIAKVTQFYLDGEDFPLTVSKIYPNDALEISQKTDYCYRFSVVGDSSSYEFCPEVLLYKRFFNKFFLYADQENLNGVRVRAIKKFQTSFSGNDNDVEYNEYIKFLTEWGSREGNKETLDRNCIKLAIALKVLSSRVKPLSFHHCSDNTVERAILREAITVFDVTIIQKESYDKIKNLWADALTELNVPEVVNKFRTTYQLHSTYIDDISKAPRCVLSVVLWLMGKCPLIVKEDASVQKILELCIGDKFILLRDDYASSFPGSVSVFETISDLKINSLQCYNQIVENLKCTLQEKEDICLKDLVQDNTDILALMKTDDLLKMSLNQCNIGEARESLSEPYIERFLLKSAIDIRILDDIATKTVVILDGVSQEDDLRGRLKKHNLVYISDYLRDQNLELRLSRKSHREISSLSTTIYLSDTFCSYDEFRAICSKNENTKQLHQFRFRPDGNLDWIRSRGDVSHVEKYKLFANYPVQERQLSSSDFVGNINLLVADPGMGKSELMKSFKMKCFSDHLTIIVDPKDVYAFLRNHRGADDHVETFLKFIFDEKYETLSHRDRQIFGIFRKSDKIIFVWDALDELSAEHRDVVIDIILGLSKKCLQWVTSRCHFENKLQTKFNVLSLKLSKFDEEQQRDYIRKRLSGADADTIIQKIQSSFVLMEHKDILGIPLQLFMLTELFLRDQGKYLALLDNFFLLTDLYKYFIEEKINILYREKLSIDLNTSSTEKLVQSLNHKMLEEYTNAALRLLFPDAILTELEVHTMTDLQDIHENHKNIGLVTEIKGQIPQFLHNSFAEYLAGRYLVRKLEHSAVLIEVMFDPKYINVRFFFDLLLAGNSKAHVAILYKNFSFTGNCDNESLTTDLGGRSALHLACSWGQRYPELSVRYTGDCYIIDDEGNFGIVPESREYLDTIGCLLRICDLSEPDRIYNMPPMEYARKATCLAAEMQIIMKQPTKSIDNDHVINILYYSTYYGYHQEFVFFFKLLKENLSDQGHTQLSRCIVDNVKNNLGMTLLYIASRMGHIDIVEFLGKAGADIDLADKEGATPLLLASQNGHDDIVEFFLKEHADVNSPDDQKRDAPLHTACTKGHDRVVESLIKAGALINLVQKESATPLYLASDNGFDRIVEILIQAGADLNLANRHGNTPLHAASAKGHEIVVKLLLAAGAGINFINKNLDAPLHVASGSGNDETVELLVNAPGANINPIQRDGATPLYIASENGHDRVVKVLVRADADVNLARHDGVTPLYIATWHGHTKIVEILVEAGADVFFPDNFGDTALHLASKRGHRNIVKFLVTRGIDVNHQDEKHRDAPLHLAVGHGHEEIVEMLVDAEADVNLLQRDGATPLYIASDNGHLKIVDFLVKSGGDVNLARSDGITPLSIASWEGHEEIVEFLVKSGANVNFADEDGDAPLHTASDNGHDRIVKFLVEAGADVDLRNKKASDTPLHVASGGGYPKIVEILVDAGADVNLRQKDGATPLYIASDNGHYEIVKFLVKRGADINIARMDGFTPLYIASWQGHGEVVNFLVKAGADGNAAEDEDGVQ